MMGLMGKTSKINMGIVDIPGKGRGVVVREHVREGAYLLEYKSAEVYERSKAQEKEEEYASNNEPCMVLEVQTPKGGIV